MSNNISVKDASNVLQSMRTLDNGTYQTPQNSHLPVAAATGNHHAPASNTAAVVTKGAVSGTYNVLGGIYWSYDADPTAGNLKIEDGSGTTVFSLDITTGGPGFFPFSPPIRNAAVNTAMIITLSSGGSGVTGKLSLNSWVETS